MILMLVGKSLKSGCLPLGGNCTEREKNTIFYAQAASGIPNPFMSDPAAGGFFGGGANFFAAPAAGGNAPPPRPPPPVSGPNSPSNASPAKSALDDLNDSIRMALGGSPAAQAQPAPSAAGQGFAAFGAAPSGAAATFSPARQGMGKSIARRLLRVRWSSP